MDHQQEDSALRGFTAQLTQLTRELLDASSVAGALQQIVVAATEVVTGADLVSVTLLASNGDFHTPAHTDPTAVLLDQVQYDFGEGPCVDAARPDGPAVAISVDLAADVLWPRFAAAALARGYASIVSTALLPDARQPRLSGALNIYSRHRGGLTPAGRDIALLLAAHASLVLASTQAFTEAEAQADHLRKAIESRDVIGQAKGILMQRRGVSADEAFGILRRASQGLNVKLADLAQVLSTRHTELPPELRAWLDQ